MKLSSLSVMFSAYIWRIRILISSGDDLSEHQTSYSCVQVPLLARDWEILNVPFLGIGDRSKCLDYGF